MLIVGYIVVAMISACAGLLVAAMIFASRDR